MILRISPILILPIALAILLSLLIPLRLLSILPAYSPPPRRRQRGSPTHLLILLGSGGHTAEILSLLSNLDPTSYTHRSWVVSDGDAFSARKAIEFEKGLLAAAAAAATTQRGSKIPINDRQFDSQEDAVKKQKKRTNTSKVPPHFSGTYTIRTIPRARRVHQSLSTTPLSSFRCLIACVKLLYISPPDLILTNGPGSAVILLLAALLIRVFTTPISVTFPSLPLFSSLSRQRASTRTTTTTSSAPSSSPLKSVHRNPQASRTLGVQDHHEQVQTLDHIPTMRSIYVESFARVKTMSLSGRILVSLGMCNRVLVQWERLQGKAGSGGGECRGVLVR